MANGNKFSAPPHGPLKPGEVRRMDSEELREFESWFILDARIHTDSFQEVMRNRLAGYPGARRDLGLMTHVSRRLINKLIDTMPAKQQSYADSMRAYGKVVLSVAGVKPPEGSIFMKNDDVDVIAGAAIDGTCSMCFKVGK